MLAKNLECYGYVLYAKEVVSEVLGEKVENGYFSQEVASDLARMIFRGKRSVDKSRSILSRPERSGGRIEGCGPCKLAPLDTRSTLFRATRDASLDIT